MKTTTRNTLTALATGTLLCILALPATAEPGFGDYQLRRLLQPTASELKWEAKDKVFIYDGLDDADIDRALDLYPERMESMMFVRVVKTTDDGVKVVEDDGC